MKQKINEMLADIFQRIKNIDKTQSRQIDPEKDRRHKSSGISGMSGGYKRSSKNQNNNKDVA